MRFIPAEALITCKSCKQQKPRAEFPPTPDGLRIGCNCKTCVTYFKEKHIVSRVSI